MDPPWAVSGAWVMALVEDRLPGRHAGSCRWLLWQGARLNRAVQSGAVTRPASVALFPRSMVRRSQQRPEGGPSAWWAGLPTKPGQVTAPGIRRPGAVKHLSLSSSGCDLTFGWIRNVVARHTGVSPGPVLTGAAHAPPRCLAQSKGTAGPPFGQHAWGCGSFPYVEWWPRR
jgi:hypothetical protein